MFLVRACLPQPCRSPCRVCFHWRLHAGSDTPRWPRTGSHVCRSVFYTGSSHGPGSTALSSSHQGRPENWNGQWFKKNLNTLWKRCVIVSVFSWTDLRYPLRHVLTELSGTVEVLNQVREETEDVQRETYKQKQDILQNKTTHTALIHSIREQMHN